MTVPLPIPARLLAGLLAAALLLNGGTARADGILWYNGDFDGRDALVNQTGAADGLVYDNFIVPTGSTFTITAVFSNNLMYDPTAASTAYWEIRSGVSAGDGGTLVASGDGADGVTATGRFEPVIPGVSNVYEYTNQVSVNVTLGAGTYWLAVAPDVSNQNSYISTTSGANAVGSPAGNDGDSFVSSTFFGANFTPTSDDSQEGPGTWDYSMGVIGTAAPTVPEPSSLLMGMVGLLASAGCLWSRRRALA
ncbi:MAG: PEP-CTERM sorting domain-containing protein [Paludisphaera borealis]|uniref:PEP-CTERM sorting domain-containing protein n=1 Tax=Paludisphaera borealis TaxID=1387353 RepID=UPI0028431F21|nr:PEP-CTERM sorting domain-containing protein [Paludisphaera borealis]MDR3618455.1 PEP-CTERM sorting domain-containing protein [Paludisphaera borealis]